MKLTTIWTMRAMSLRERLARTKEWAAMTVAAHLPSQVRYWVVIQVASQTATIPPHDQQHPMSVTTEEILENLHLTT